MQFPPIDIDDTNPFTLDTRRVSPLRDTTCAFIEVWNDGPDTVYYGEYAPDFTIAHGFNVKAANNKIDLYSGGKEIPGARDIRAGMVVTATGPGFNPGTYVTAVYPTHMVLSDTPLVNQVDLVITFTTQLDETNGLPLLINTGRSFTRSNPEVHFTDGVWRFIVASGDTAVLRLRYKQG